MVWRTTLLETSWRRSTNQKAISCKKFGWRPRTPIMRWTTLSGSRNCETSTSLNMWWDFFLLLTLSDVQLHEVNVLQKLGIDKRIMGAFAVFRNKAYVAYVQPAYTSIRNRIVARYRYVSLYPPNKLPNSCLNYSTLVSRREKTTHWVKTKWTSQTTPLKCSVRSEKSWRHRQVF